MKRIKEIAETRVRYGYRRVHVLMRREGWLVNAKRVCRLYREMGLQLRNKSPNAESKHSCARTARRRAGLTRFGQWILSMISCSTGARSGF